MVGVTCRICKKLLSSLGNLSHHLKTHDNPETRKVACSQCDRVYLTPDALKDHVRKSHEGHLNPKPYPCTYCDNRFWTSTERNGHIRTHAGDRTFPCTAQGCGRTFGYSSTLKTHIRNVHASAEEAYVCPEAGCGKQFRNPRGLKRHLPQHTEGGRAFDCHICPKSYKWNEGLARHLRRAHQGSERQHSCTYCSKKFFYPGDLVDHVRSHTKERPHACLNCNMKYMRAGNLRVHLKFCQKTEVDLNLLVCPATGCGRQFKNPYGLKAHVAVHSDPRERQTFSCPSPGCGKKFKSKDGLKFHVRFQHEGQEMRHNCGYCGKKFTTGQQLSDHTRVHTGEKPYACPRCGSRFNQLGSLKGHLEVHKDKDERATYPCTICDKRLSHRTGLRAHMLCHGNREEYEKRCPICGTTFARQGGLLVHMRRFHRAE